MRIAVCDDNIQDLSQISILLNIYKEQHCSTLTFELFNTPVALLESLSHNAYDLLLLDIVMPEMSGIELAATIRAFNTVLPIIFLTTSTEFAVASYRVHAKDYLLKPISTSKLEEALSKQIRITEQTLTIKLEDTLTQIPFSDIVFMETLNRYVHIYLTDGSVLQSLIPLHEYETKLSLYPQFYKPHRSYLIHLAHITKLDKDGFHTTLNTLIPIPRSRLTDSKNAYMNYLMNSEHVF